MVARGGLACSRLRGSRVQEIEKAREHENKMGGKLGEEGHVVSLPLSPFLFSATTPFSQITRSQFRLPFTYASSPLTKSLEQARGGSSILN